MQAPGYLSSTRRAAAVCSPTGVACRGSLRVVLARSAAAAPPTSSLGIPPALLESGGLDPSTQSEEQLQGYNQSLRGGFLGVKLLTPGLRVLNLDPPVLVVDNLISSEVCEQLMREAEASGGMQVSRVGGANGGAGGDDQVRTSTTLAMTRDTLAAAPGLKPLLNTVLAAAEQLLELPGPLTTSLFSKPSGVGQIAPELPQIARYQPGQHFLSHEDAFPPPIALQKGYQRRATLLVYLNDVREGGATRFDRLGFSVQPKQGRALLFFPAFSGGMPDSRTLHTARDAVDEKWIFQLWLTSGLPTPRAQPAAAAASSKRGSKSSKKRR